MLDAAGVTGGGTTCGGTTAGTTYIIVHDRLPKVSIRDANPIPIPNYLRSEQRKLSTNELGEIG